MSKPTILEMSERCHDLAYYTGSDLLDILLRVAAEALSCAHDQERNQPVRFEDLNSTFNELETLL